MNEIKFRAWDNDAKVWIKNLDIQPIQWLNKHANSMKFMQFTGLKDKHETEIYEGDVLTRYDAHNRNTKRKAEVIFIQGSIIAVENKRLPTERRWNLWSMCKNFEVIGNIFENSELLN